MQQEHDVCWPAGMWPREARFLVVPLSTQSYLENQVFISLLYTDYKKVLVYMLLFVHHSLIGWFLEVSNNKPQPDLGICFEPAKHTAVSDTEEASMESHSWTSHAPG